jgi:hypothetical protein
MPYKIVCKKLGEGKIGCFVQNKETGKRYSNKPMSMEKAKAQKRLLEAFTGRHEKKPKA